MENEDEIQCQEKNLKGAKRDPENWLWKGPIEFNCHNCHWTFEARSLGPDGWVGHTNSARRQNPHRPWFGISLDLMAYLSVFSPFCLHFLKRKVWHIALSRHLASQSLNFNPFSYRRVEKSLKGRENYVMDFFRFFRFLDFFLQLFRLLRTVKGRENCSRIEFGCLYVVLGLRGRRKCEKRWRERG